MQRHSSEARLQRMIAGGKCLQVCGWEGAGCLPRSSSGTPTSLGGAMTSARSVAEGGAAGVRSSAPRRSHAAEKGVSVPGAATGVGAQPSVEWPHEMKTVWYTDTTDHRTKRRLRGWMAHVAAGA